MKRDKSSSIFFSFLNISGSQIGLIGIWLCITLMVNPLSFRSLDGLGHFSSPPLNAQEKTESHAGSFLSKLAQAAEDRLKQRIKYDGSYFKIKYPMGDVPSHIGVCTDVLIRSYRALGVDLQKEVHVDMKKNFSQYPEKWGLKKPDTNIDHRRVLNLMTFFTRMGSALPISSDPKAFSPGDIVAWNLGNGLMHIGIVSSQKSDEGTPLIVHNIGMGPKRDNMLFDFSIIGHFRYEGKPSNP